MNKFEQGWQDLRARGTVFWQARTEQERRFLGAGAAVVALGLFYGLLISPAVEGRAKLRKALPELRQQAAELQALALEASALRGQNTIAPPPMTRDSLNSGLAARGLTPKSLTMTGEYAKLQFSGVPFAGVMAWLDAIRNEGRITVQEASFTPQGAAGMVDATLTLRQSAGGQP